MLETQNHPTRTAPFLIHHPLHRAVIAAVGPSTGSSPSGRVDLARGDLGGEA